VVPPALLLLYYLIVWLRYGRDPKPGPIVPRYTPPPGITPAAARYVLRNWVDGRTLAAVLVDLAWRKRITIEPQGADKYRVRFVASPPPEPLPPEEHIAMELLLAWNTPTTADPVTLDMSYVPRNSGLVSGIWGSLQRQYDGVFYRQNLGWITLGLLATCLWAGALVWITPAWSGEIAVLTASFMLLAVMLVITASSLKNALTARAGARKAAFLFSLVVALLVLLGFFAARIASGSSVQFVGTLCLLVAISTICVPLMKGLTEKGREITDYLAGYREYLVTVHSDAMDRMNTPAQSPGALNEHLPYAIALDVRVNWGDHFSGAFFFSAASSDT
jgi:hypothetical protein